MRHQVNRRTCLRGTCALLGLPLLEAMLPRLLANDQTAKANVPQPRLLFIDENHETAARRLEYWLKAPGVKPDGDFVDGDGGFEYATYAKDLLRAVEREMAIAPVRPTLDGTYRRFIPASPYARGSMVREIHGTYSLADIEMGALPLADDLGVLGPADPRIGEQLDLIEELLDHGKPAPSTTQERFRTGFAGLVKYMFVDKIHLRRDDVPSFLRSWMNNYAAWVTVEGGFPEPNSLGRYTGDPAKKPSSDLGSTGWFVESFRNLLVMEDGQSLWLARATPRAWLEQGKKISIKNAPTHFGTVGYEIVSDVDNGKINTTIEMPARKVTKEVVLRFRHPKSAPIKAVTVNGKPWTEFNKDKEAITLKGLTGTVAVTAQY